MFRTTLLAGIVLAVLATTADAGERRTRTYRADRYVVRCLEVDRCGRCRTI